jgi:hypothetical protein
MSTRAACPGGARVEIKLTYHPYPTSRNILPHRIIPRLFHAFSQSFQHADNITFPNDHFLHLHFQCVSVALTIGPHILPASYCREIKQESTRKNINTLKAEKKYFHPESISLCQNHPKGSAFRSNTS